MVSYYIVTDGKRKHVFLQLFVVVDICVNQCAASYRRLHPFELG